MASIGPFDQKIVLSLFRTGSYASKFNVFPESSLKTDYILFSDSVYQYAHTLNKPMFWIKAIFFIFWFVFIRRWNQALEFQNLKFQILEILVAGIQIFEKRRPSSERHLTQKSKCGHQNQTVQCASLSTDFSGKRDCFPCFVAASPSSLPESKQPN